MSRDYIVNPEKRVVGEAKNYDSHSRQGLLNLYYVEDGGRFQEAVLDDSYEVIEEHHIEKDESLRKSLLESRYQVWRFQNRILLQSDYERTRRNLFDFDRFCRGYYVSTNKGELHEFLTQIFSDCMEYCNCSFYLDSKREIKPER